MWPTLLTNLTIIALMVAAWADLQAWVERHSSLTAKLTFGLLTGSASVLSMSLRTELAPGVIFDLRNAAVGLAGLFGGFPGLLVASSLAVAMRLAIGGVGIHAGLAALCFAAISGLLGNFALRRGMPHGASSLMVAVGVTSGSFLGSVFLPEAVRAQVMGPMFFTVAGLSFLATLVSSELLVWRQDRVRERLLLLAAVRQSPGYLYVKDLAGKFVAANHNVAKIHHRGSPDELRGLTDWDLEAERRAAALVAAEQRLLRTGDPITNQVEEVTIDGRRRWFETTKAPVRLPSGDIVGLVGATQDITGLKLMELELRSQRDRLSTIQSEMADGMAVFDENGALIEVNRLYQEMFPLTGHLRTPGANLSTILSAAADSGEQLGVATRKADWIKEVMSTLRHGGSEEVRLYDGRWLHIRTKPMADGGAVVLVSDITVIKQAEMNLLRMTEELKELASTDGLTLLKNRRSFDAALQQELSRARRAGSDTSLLLLDVDRFKAFNDTYGHPAGDACLQRIARVLRDQAKRPADMAARYGGEEFVVMLPDTSEDGAFRLAENIRLALRSLALEHVSSEKGIVTVSIGIATALGGEEPTSLLSRADAALYDAKAAGRDRAMGWRNTELPQPMTSSLTRRHPAA